MCCVYGKSWSNTKKLLWQHISKEMKTELNIDRIYKQLQNKYKEIIYVKRKNTVDHNNKSGNSRTDIQFEEGWIVITECAVYFFNL